MLWSIRLAFVLVVVAVESLRRHILERWSVAEGNYDELESSYMQVLLLSLGVAIVLALGFASLASKCFVVDRRGEAALDVCAALACVVWGWNTFKTLALGFT